MNLNFENSVHCKILVTVWKKIDTVKPLIRVDFLFFLFGFSIDSHYRSTLVRGRLLLIFLCQYSKFFQKCVQNQFNFLISSILFNEFNEQQEKQLCFYIQKVF